MSTPVTARTLADPVRRRVARCCAILMLGLLFSACEAAGRADDGPDVGEGWSLGSAALLVRRLPPTAESAADLQPQAGQAAPAFALRPVTLLASDSSDPLPAWNDSGAQLYLGYDRGFVIAADQGRGSDAASADFLMRVNSWLHLRQTVFASDGPNPDQNSFSFERLRLTFGGHVMTPDLTYFLQLDGNSDRSTQTIFLDYFVTYDVGHNLLGLDRKRLGLKAGKWKVPFSRSRAETGRRLQFTDRATANVFFDLNRSIGVGLTGSLDPSHGSGRFSGPLQIETAIFNGFRTGSVSTTRGNGLDRNFGWSLRLFRDLCGEFGADGEPDLSWHDQPALRVGGGFAFTRTDVEGPSEFSRQRVVDSGATLASLLPVTVTAYDAWLSTVDAHLKYRGLAVIAEYYWRSLGQFQGAAVPDLLDDGFVLQMGYFAVPHKLELIARWSRIVGDSGTLGLLDESSDEFGAGFVWYIKGHNVKWTFDASRFTSAPVNSARLDLLPGDAGWLFRTQFQLSF